MHRSSAIDTSLLSQWIGRYEERADRVSAASLAALSATLNRDDPEPKTGSVLPPLWHWMFFTPLTPQHRLGQDGHPKVGGFLPPVPLPRRMWAGGKLEFTGALQVGDEITRRSTIRDIKVKEGRSGPLVFVSVQHEIANSAGVAVSEQQEIVYRQMPVAGAAAVAPRPAPVDETFAREVEPDPVLLFRYSALTFNGHRIHYDRPYTTEVEGYPGLVVHGPLIATLLVDLLRRNRPQVQLHRFDFRAVGPIFDTHRFTLCGKEEGDKRILLWARDHRGALAMEATAILR